MIECILLGDSISVGLRPHLPCILQAQVGRNSHHQSVIIRNITAKLVIVSLGSNDVGDPMLMKNQLRHLRIIRRNIDADKVIWILPYHNQGHENIRRVAAENGDGLLDLINFRTNDGVHPRNYKEVASELR
jgi:lysophospholipase L1-like esterase